MKITEYPSVTDLEDTNVFLLDGPSGTKKIAKSDLVYALFNNIPEMHNKIYRGKNLGSTLTSGQKAAIENGTFDDIWVGDYWQISTHKYYVAHIDYFTDSTHPHTVVVFPNATASSIAWDSTTSGGAMGGISYTQSTIYRTDLPNYIANTIPGTFKSNLAEHAALLNSASSGTNPYGNTSTSSVRRSANVPSIVHILGRGNPYELLRQTSGWHDQGHTSDGEKKFALFDFVNAGDLGITSEFWTVDQNGPIAIAITPSGASGFSNDMITYRNKNDALSMLAYFVIHG